MLALHLKRFKYVESLGRFKKLAYRVSFPMELSMENVVNDGAAHAGRTYHLFAVVVHLGSGPNHGHYVSLVRAPGRSSPACSVSRRRPTATEGGAFMSQQ